MPQYRADQIGSLTRPEPLKQARAAFRAGQLDPSALRQVEDEAILDALAHQAQIGIPIVTDGEFRRDAWQTDVSDAVQGFVEQYPVVKRTLPDGQIQELEMHTKAVRDRLRPIRRITANFLPFLQHHTGRPFKVTMPSPAMVSRGAFLKGTTEMRTRPDTTCCAICCRSTSQRCAPWPPKACRTSSWMKASSPTCGRTGARRFVPKGWIPSRSLPRTLPPRILVGICFRQTRSCAPSTCVVAAAPQRAAAVTTSGWRSACSTSSAFNGSCSSTTATLSAGFDPLRFLPKGKTVVLGLVTSKDPRLEDEDDLLRRIDEAARYVSVEQLAISPQCGFGGSADNAFMTRTNSGKSWSWSSASLTEYGARSRLSNEGGRADDGSRTDSPTIPTARRRRCWQHVAACGLRPGSFTRQSNRGSYVCADRRANRCVCTNLGECANVGTGRDHPTDTDGFRSERLDSQVPERSPADVSPVGRWPRA